MVVDFLKPFYHSFKYKNLKVEVTEANIIPTWARADWKLYQQTLFHILQNAIKFNTADGSIHIVLSFHHSLSDEFGRTSRSSQRR